MLINAVIEETKQQSIYAYQDDIVIGSDSFDKTCTKLQSLLNVHKEIQLNAVSSEVYFSSRFHWLPLGSTWKTQDQFYPGVEIRSSQLGANGI